jgi:hypothetical protein
VNVVRRGEVWKEKIVKGRRQMAFETTFNEKFLREVFGIMNYDL